MVILLKDLPGLAGCFLEFSPFSTRVQQIDRSIVIAELLRKERYDTSQELFRVKARGSHSSNLIAGSQLFGPLYDLLLEVALKRFQPGDHAVEVHGDDP